VYHTLLYIFSNFRVLLNFSIFIVITRRMKTTIVGDMVALLIFPFTTFPELFGHYNDMGQDKTFRTLI